MRFTAGWLTDVAVRLLVEALRRRFLTATVAHTVPLLVVAPQASPAKGLPGLLDLLREKPGAYDYGSAGNGSVQHMAGLAVDHIPYRGNPTAQTDRVAGRLDAGRRGCLRRGGIGPVAGRDAGGWYQGRLSRPYQ